MLVWVKLYVTLKQKQTDMTCHMQKYWAEEFLTSVPQLAVVLEEFAAGELELLKFGRVSI